MQNINSKMSRNLILGSLTSVIFVLTLLWLFPVLTHHFELKMTDLKFKLRDSLNKNPDLSSEVVMVNIDDYSKKESGYDLWPYSYYAKTIEKINAGNPCRKPRSEASMGPRHYADPCVSDCFSALFAFFRVPKNA